MTIRTLVMGCASAMMALLILCGFVGLARINEIRMGGPLQIEAQQASDVVADILPPPEYVIEPYLEATMMVGDRADMDAHLQRLAQLRQTFNERHAYWMAQELDPKVKHAITDQTYQSASRFWDILDQRLVPALGAGDEAAVTEAYRMLSDAYLAHRKDVDGAVITATEHQKYIAAHAADRLAGAKAILGALAATLFAIVGSFCALVLLRVIRPIRTITSHMEDMAAGQPYERMDESERPDEIGDVARALDGIVIQAEARSREESEQELARQTRIVTTLGQALSCLKQGVLHHRILEEFPDDYAQLRDDYNAAVVAIGEVIAQVKRSVVSLNGSAGEISDATQDLSQRTEHQAANLQQTAASMEQLTGRVHETAEAATSASQAVSIAEREADSNAGIVTDAVEAMSGIEQSAQGIARIIAVIDDLAFQTNLLSLNASVEAARAGEAGKSFAVVAEEVRALAQRSAAAAKDIRGLIEDSTRQVSGGVQLVGRTGEAIKSIMDNVSQVSGLITRIATAAGEQADGLAEINGAVGSMDRMTQQNAAMGEQCNAAARLLHHEADALTELISRFDLGEGAARAA